MRILFLTNSPIGSIDERVFLLTNQRVVLMGLKELTLDTTVCTTSRLDVMSLPVDCVFQVKYHKTLAQYMESGQNMHVLWLLAVKYAIYHK